MATTAGGQASKRGGDWRRCTVQINYPMHSFAAPDVRVERNNKRFSFIDRSIRLPCNALFPTYLRVYPRTHSPPPQFGSLVLQFSSSTINANRFHLQTLFVQHFRESFNKLCAWHFPGNFSATTNVLLVVVVVVAPAGSAVAIAVRFWLWHAEYLEACMSLTWITSL